MTQAPLATTLRVFFALALAVISIALVFGVIGNVYPEPSQELDFESIFEDSDFEGSGFSAEDFDLGSDESADYERNIGAIFSLVGIAAMAGGIAGFRASLNPLRTGLLIAGSFIFMIGVIRASGGSTDALVILWAGLAIAALVYVGRWLDDGHPDMALATWPGAPKAPPPAA